MLVAADARSDGNLDLLPGERWFLAWTLSYREATAEMHLRRQGFRSFLPRHKKTVRHARKLRTVTAPIFPRYLFVVLDLKRDRWRSVNGTTVIVNLFMAHGRPVPVPDGIVETLIQSTDGSGNLRFDDSLEPGQKIRHQIREEKRALIPAVTHVDGSGRLQTVYHTTNPCYWNLIEAFRELTGVPIVLNTSFNENEPVVCRPQEALDCFLRTNMDVLVLGSFLIERRGTA
jgi:transcription antitermination factor NusG